MALRLKSLLLLSLSVHLSTQECRTVSKPSINTTRAPKVNTPCVFPFYHKGSRFDGCKELKPSSGTYWCSTKVSKNGTHIKGEFGFCGDNCRVHGVAYNDTSCPIHKTCMFKDQCSLYKKYEKIKNDGSQESRKTKSELIKSICNKELKRLCCKDNIQGSEITIATTTITATTRETKVNTTVEVQVLPRDNINPFFPDACEPNPGQGFSGSALPTKGQCGIKCNRLATVVGGKDAELGEFPWAALLGYNIVKRVWSQEINDYQNKRTIGWKCGGTLINSWYVLTAAHCVLGKKGKRNKRLVKVKLGELTVGSDPDCPHTLRIRTSLEGCLPSVQEIDVGEVIVHKYYNWTKSGEQKGLFNDIALIRLKTEATLNLAVQFACLPHPDIADIIGASNFEDDLVGRNATVIGWGQTANYYAGDYELHSVAETDLKKLDVPVVSHQDCSQKYTEPGVLITEKHLCAGGEIGKDSCRGDSGGGLFIQSNVSTFENPIRPFVQIGVVSFGSKHCATGNPTVFTRVTQFIQWIQNHLES